MVAGGSETSHKMPTWKTLIVGAMISIFSTAFGYVLLPWADWWNFLMKSPEMTYSFKMHKPNFVYNWYDLRRFSEKPEDRRYYGYFFRVDLKNSSDQITAQGCQVYVTRMMHLSENGQFQDDPNFTPFAINTMPPVILNWLPDISPQMTLQINLGRIMEPDFQKKYDTESYGGDHTIPAFRFDYKSTPGWSDPQLLRGAHRFALTAYFKNRRPIEKTFLLDWTGNFIPNDPDKMRREVNLKMLD